VVHLKIFLLSLKLKGYQVLAHGVHSSRLDINHLSVNAWRNHDSVLVEEIVLIAGSNDISRSDEVSNLDA